MYSPKHECLLGQIEDNLEQGDENEPATAGILPLCPTRWAMRASCFRRILENYSALLEEWKKILTHKLQQDVKQRILRCQSPIQAFEFLFGLSFGERLFSHSDNLSMSAVNG